MVNAPEQDDVVLVREQVCVLAGEALERHRQGLWNERALDEDVLKELPRERHQRPVGVEAVHHRAACAGELAGNQPPQQPKSSTVAPRAWGRTRSSPKKR